MEEPQDTESQDPTPEAASPPEEAAVESAAAPVAEAAPKSAVPEAFDAEALVGVQHEGIEARSIIAFVFFLIIAIGVVVWGAMGWFESVADKAHQDAAANLENPERRQLELSAAELLNTYEVINAEQGVYRIPLNRAIDLVVEESRQTPDANYSQELQLFPGN